MHIRAMFGETLLFMSLIFSATAAQPLTPPAPHAQRISVQTQGAGTDVILIPGLASSREVWADLAAELRKKHRIHLVELAGFANTPAIANPEGKVIAPAAEAIADYIQAQHINAPAIIGHSLGGEIALMLGARYPSQVGRLMIVDALPFYTLMIDPAATSETAERHAAPMRDWLQQQSPEQFEASQQASIARLAMTEAVRPALVAASIRSDRKTVADAVYELMVTDLRPELGRIKAQMEIVYAYDALFGIPATRVEGMYRQAYASAPHIRFTRIDESFHFVMLDQPERFASAVKAFLKE
ncbi:MULTISPECIES: alpha/beta fold hydrolase [unclassified Pantoea]|uniref:alpha/beta fold hydrolase n=1 Tax=unclassified Pantoea TaxID=2630326 RepID=UPI002580712C|nr:MULTISPECIES: alpha/beta hydrolase [unclassified Pantoea]MDU5475334.1 alpha/beta hydrolase [Pantoea sp.]